MSSVALLRLLQLCDSSFPVGGFAYSHGLEWLVHEGIVRDEATLTAYIETYIDQGVRAQWLPGALAGACARTAATLRLVDRRFHVSFSNVPEREASIAMGERLAIEARGAFGYPAERGVRHFAVVYGHVAGWSAIEPEPMLQGLGFTMVQSVVQAAMRLGLVGQSAAMRVSADAQQGIVAAARAAAARPQNRRFGALSPGMDVALTLQPTLRFRMFAS